MTILAHDAILRAIDAGELVFTPFQRDQVGPASVDLTLGNSFRVFKKVGKILHVTDAVTFTEITDQVELQDGNFLLLMPGELVHGITQERIQLPDYLVGWIEGRSRFGRIGLMIHVTAGLVQPGCNNKQVLEISNMSPMPLALYPGTRICQIVLEETRGTARYTGTFRDQTQP
jgi:dCTP deaminase